MEKTTAIKFFWNGLKLNGSRQLVKCWYSTESQQEDRPRVTIYAKGCGRGDLPADIFPVENESDSYQDIYRADKATIYENHPLYKFARYAAEKAHARDAEQRMDGYRQEIARADPKRYPNLIKARTANLEAEEKRLATFQAMKDPGQPTAADLAAVEAMNSAAESARIAAEHEAQLKERERVIDMQNEGKVFIRETTKAHPLRKGAPVVHVTFSECPAFYSFKDGLALSVSAAEIIFSHYNQHLKGENRGCDTTDFLITELGKDGEDTYTGRYDIGSEDGGLIQHIRDEAANLAEWGSCFNHKPSQQDLKDAAEIAAVADQLEAHTTGGRVVSVTLAPWVAKAMEEKRKADEQEHQDLMDAVDMLTDEQLEEAILMIRPDDKENLDVARFFLQKLATRDEKKALAIFRRWQAGKTPESA